MRLRSLTLENYGIFRAQRIVFDATPGRINLLIAPNGAGKSILRNAFCDLLFGIHGQIRWAFATATADAAACRSRSDAADAAGVRSPQGPGQHTDRRRRRDARSHRARAVLGTADRTLVERLFALDTERLRAAGEELLASNGSVADALLSAAGGLRHARQLQQSLLATRDSLAPLRRSQGRPFYQSLDRMLAARQLVANAC